MGFNDNERDASLWNQFKTGDPASFSAIFRNYYADLFNYGCKITGNHPLIEDSIQELFLDIWRSGGKAEIVSLKAYIFKAFKFKMLRLLEKDKKSTAELPLENVHSFELSHEHFMVVQEQDAAAREKLLTAIQELSPRQKEIIYLKFYLHLSYDEVSDIMGINYQASRNLAYQSIKVLKRIISFHIIFVSFLH